MAYINENAPLPLPSAFLTRVTRISHLQLTQSGSDLAGSGSLKAAAALRSDAGTLGLGSATISSDAATGRVTVDHAATVSGELRATGNVVADASATVGSNLNVAALTQTAMSAQNTASMTGEGWNGSVSQSANYGIE